MRRIVRTSAKIPTLYAKRGSGYKKAAAILDQFERAQIRVNARGSCNVSFPDHWNKADVRGALYAQQGRACAFCDRELPEGDRGDVEHYRPKGRVAGSLTHGGYWWLAYQFDNYLLSCRICNSSHKGSKFPLRTARAKWFTYEKRNKLPDEARLLLDPAADLMEELIWYDWESRLCPALPAPDLKMPYRKQAKGMIDFFQLNKRHRLVGDRIIVAQRVLTLIDEGKYREAGELAVRFRPYSLLAKQILVDTGMARYMPTPDEEFEWLFNDIRQELLLAMEILERLDLDYKDYKPFNELLWSLAILVYDSDPVARAKLKRRLELLGLWELVDNLEKQMV